jgi:hypothetical protein
MLISPLKQALHNLKVEMSSFDPSKYTHPSVNRWFKWLAPGLSVKRWLLISATGIIMTILGLAIWFRLKPVYRLLELISDILEAIARIIPNYISGPLALIVGIFLVFWGQTRTVETITDVLVPERDEELVDLLLARRRLNKGPKIVSIGGGTGLSTLLRGLRDYSANIRRSSR